MMKIDEMPKGDKAQLLEIRGKLEELRKYKDHIIDTATQARLNTYELAELDILVCRTTAEIRRLDDLANAIKPGQSQLELPPCRTIKWYKENARIAELERELDSRQKILDELPELLKVLISASTRLLQKKDYAGEKVSINRANRKAKEILSICLKNKQKFRGNS